MEMVGYRIKESISKVIENPSHTCYSPKILIYQKGHSHSTLLGKEKAVTTTYLLEI